MMLKGKETKNGIEFSAREYRNELLRVSRLNSIYRAVTNGVVALCALFGGINLGFGFIQNSGWAMMNGLFFGAVIWIMIIISTKLKQKDKHGTMEARK